MDKPQQEQIPEQIVVNTLYNEVSSFESLCMKCFKKGETKILLTKIPFFQDILVMSFDCEFCGFRNNEIQTAAPLKDKGIKFDLKVSKPEDLERMVVAGFKSLIYLPDIEFEAPSMKTGIVTTVQGLIMSFEEDLKMSQDLRKENQPELYQKIEEILTFFHKCLKGEKEIFPFHFIIDDASGNSFISNPYAPLVDNNLKEEHYTQTKEHLYKLGYISDQEYLDSKQLQEKVEEMQDYKKYDEKLEKKKEAGLTDKDIHNMMSKMQGFNKKKDAHKLDHSKTVQEQELDQRLTILQGDCAMCGQMGELTTCTCEIPFFKEICIMSFLCPHCGYKDSEVKTLGEIGDKGKIITLQVDNEDDLNRDIFKSNTAIVHIPQLGLELTAGTLGSFYSTVEGLLEKILDDFTQKNPFVGDSADEQEKKKLQDFTENLKKMKNGDEPFTLIIDDPTDNCFILNPFYPEEDKKVTIEEYVRTKEQDEDLGLIQQD